MYNGGVLRKCSRYIKSSESFQSWQTSTIIDWQKLNN